MSSDLTCYTARWVLPVTSPPIRDGAVVVAGDGTIADVCPAADAPPHARVEALGDVALIPGLVNVHAHPELTPFRGLLEDRPFNWWIPDLVRLKRAAALSQEDYEVAALWACAEALANGITTLAATEDSAAALHAMIVAKMRGIVYQEVFGPAPDDAGVAVARLARKVAALRTRETSLVRIGVSPHAPYTVSDELYRRTAALALAEALPIAVHAAEAEVEALLVRDARGPFADALRARGIPVHPRARSTIALLEETGVLAARPLVIHAIRVDEEDIAALSVAGAPVAHCPIANARLGHGIAPVLDMLEAGITVGLGTDSVASNNRLDLLEEARAAQLFQRARTGSADTLGAERLLRMATLDGARALGLDDRIGSLEPGKEADLCAVALDRPHTSPVHDPFAALILAARGSDVVLTMVRGRVLYRAGRHTELAVTDLRPRLEAIAARLREAGKPT